MPAHPSLPKSIDREDSLQNGEAHGLDGRPDSLRDGSTLAMGREMSRLDSDLPEPDATLKRAVEELQWKTLVAQNAWGLGKTERWDADLDTGLITFSGEGKITYARLQVIGTYLPADETFLWGWDHPSVDPLFAKDSLLVRDFGDRYGLSRYTSGLIGCSHDEAWQFTALAAHLSQAAGAYRGPTEENFLFMTFHDVTTGTIT